MRFTCNFILVKKVTVIAVVEAAVLLKPDEYAVSLPEVYFPHWNTCWCICVSCDLQVNIESTVIKTTLETEI